LFNRVKNQHVIVEKLDISEKFGEYKENNKENKSFAVFKTVTLVIVTHYLAFNQYISSNHFN